MEVDGNADGLIADLERRGVRATASGGAIHIENADAAVYDHIRDALVASGAPLRRMAPRRRALAELFAREGDETPAAGPR